MKVAVNVRALVPGRIGGLEDALRSTLSGVLDSGVAEIEVTLLTSAASSGAFPEWHGRVRERCVPRGAPDRALAGALAGHDVLWCPLMFLDPAVPALPAVTTIPDLQHETFRQNFTADVLAERIRELRNTVARSRRILTPSEFSKRQIVARYALPPEHVVVVPHDYGARFDVPRDPARLAGLRRRYRLPQRYCLYPANLWPHKNHTTLRRALSRYEARFGPPPTVVLTGHVEADRRGEVAAWGGTVRHIGYVDPEDMPYLYDGALMLLFPSRFEGFGLPVVEAMRRGVPVVASRETSVPEVAGGHAVLVDPADPDAIAGAVHRVIADPEAARECARRGRQHAMRYGRGRAARRTVEVLREVAAEKGRPSATVRGRAPKVFVVTPSFNQGPFLRETVESVLSQDYERLEYFVADGGSTDGSVDILRSYGDRLAWRSKPDDGGQAAAIGEAWRGTDADIVAWLNSDDTYLEGAVSAAVGFLRAHPEISMVYGEAWHTDGAGRRLHAYPTRHPFRRTTLARNCFICQPTVFLRREVLDVVGMPDPELRCALDYDLWIRVSRRFRVGYLPRFVATSRLHAMSKTVSERDRVYDEIVLVTRRHFGDVHTEWITGYLHHRLRPLLGRFVGLIPERPRRALFAALANRRRTPPAEVP